MWLEGVYLAVSMKLVVSPLALVSEATVRVEQFSVSMHMIVFPFALIPASLWEVADTISFFFAFDLISFVNRLKIK